MSRLEALDVARSALGSVLQCHVAVARQAIAEAILPNVEALLHYLRPAQAAATAKAPCFSTAALESKRWLPLTKPAFLIGAEGRT